MQPSATRRKPARPTPGTFRPAPPKDHADLLRLFAIAAKVVCADPRRLDTVSARLAEVTSGLLAPESDTREHCARLWAALARTLGSMSPGQAPIAGRAFINDLDELGSRLELMPLSAWDQLPDCLEDPGSRSPVAPVEVGAGKSVEVVLATMKRELSGHGLSPLARAKATAPLLAEIAAEARGHLLQRMVEDRALERKEALMLTRFLSKPAREVSSGDEALVEALDRAGRWLAAL